MKKFISILLILLVTSLIISPLLINYLELDLSEPVNKRYRNDELSFLKTFYLMEQGSDYYTSFKLSRENLAGEIKLGTDTFTWRSPIIFLVWSMLLDNGDRIFTLFIFLSLLVLACIFLIVKKIAGLKIAVVSTGLLSLYFLDTIFYKTAFLFTEWWGMLFIIFAFTALIYKYNSAATLLFTLAVLIREIFILPVLVLFAVEVFFRRKTYWIYLVPIIIFIIFYLLHSYFITSLLNKTSDFTLLERLHSFEWVNLQRMLSFSMRRLVIFNLKTHYLIFILGIISPLIYLLFGYKSKKEVLALFVFILTFVALLSLTSVYENDYWGIMFMPLIIILAPIFLAVFKEDKKV